MSPLMNVLFLFLPRDLEFAWDRVVVKPHSRKKKLLRSGSEVKPSFNEAALLIGDPNNAYILGKKTLILVQGF